MLIYWSRSDSWCRDDRPFCKQMSVPPKLRPANNSGVILRAASPSGVIPDFRLSWTSSDGGRSFPASALFHGEPAVLLVNTGASFVPASSRLVPGRLCSRCSRQQRPLYATYAATSCRLSVPFCTIRLEMASLDETRRPSVAGSSFARCRAACEVEGVYS